eukprot:ctg_2018.g552
MNGQSLDGVDHRTHRAPSPPERPLDEAYERGHEDAVSVITGLCREMYRHGWVTGTGGGISVRQGDTERSGATPTAQHGAAGVAVLPAVYARVSDAQRRSLYPHALASGGPGHAAAADRRCRGVSYDTPGDDQGRAAARISRHVGGAGDRQHRTGGATGGVDGRGHASVHATPAVLVRRHGLYVWGRDYVQAKTVNECLDYLFEVACRMHAMGIDHTQVPPDCAECRQPK